MCLCFSISLTQHDFGEPTPGTAFAVRCGGMWGGIDMADSPNPARTSYPQTNTTASTAARTINNPYFCVPCYSEIKVW